MIAYCMHALGSSQPHNCSVAILQIIIIIIIVVRLMGTDTIVEGQSSITILQRAIQILRAENYALKDQFPSILDAIIDHPIHQNLLESIATIRITVVEQKKRKWHHLHQPNTRIVESQRRQRQRIRKVL